MTPTPKLQASEDGWDQWAVYVLKELERLNESSVAQRREMSLIRAEIAALKVKAGFWGAAGAAIPVLVLLAVQLLSR